MTKKKFLYNLSRASYQKNWGNDYQPPTFWRKIPRFPGSDSSQIRAPEGATTQNAYA